MGACWQWKVFQDVFLSITWKCKQIEKYQTFVSLLKSNIRSKAKQTRQFEERHSRIWWWSWAHFFIASEFWWLNWAIVNTWEFFAIILAWDGGWYGSHSAKSSVSSVLSTVETKQGRKGGRKLLGWSLPEQNIILCLQNFYHHGHVENSSGVGEKCAIIFQFLWVFQKPQKLISAPHFE